MRFTIPTKGAVLKPDEFDNDEFIGFQCLHPASKFGQVLFLYRLADVKAPRIKIDFKNARTVAVIV